MTGPEAAYRLGRWLWQLLNYGLPVLFVLIPVASFLVHSLYHVDVEDFEIIKSPLSLVNFERLLSDQIYIPLFLKTCWLALQVAAICLVIGYPVAYFLASLHGRAKYAVTLLFVIPLLMSYLIKIYAIQGNPRQNRFSQPLAHLSWPAGRADRLFRVQPHRGQGCAHHLPSCRSRSCPFSSRWRRYRSRSWRPPRTLARAHGTRSGASSYP